jgi:hypothetical protein
LARGCTAPANAGALPLKVADLEAQRVHTLTRQELLSALLEGKFKEVKWTATVALAILKERQ